MLLMLFRHRLYHPAMYCILLPDVGRPILPMEKLRGIVSRRPMVGYAFAPAMQVHLNRSGDSGPMLPKDPVCCV